MPGKCWRAPDIQARILEQGQISDVWPIKAMALGTQNVHFIAKAPLYCHCLSDKVLMLWHSLSQPGLREAGTSHGQTGTALGSPETSEQGTAACEL